MEVFLLRSALQKKIVSTRACVDRNDAELGLCTYLCDCCLKSGEDHCMDGRSELKMKDSKSTTLPSIKGTNSKECADSASSAKKDTRGKNVKIRPPGEHMR